MRKFSYIFFFTVIFLSGYICTYIVLKEDRKSTFINLPLKRYDNFIEKTLLNKQIEYEKEVELKNPVIINSKPTNPVEVVFEWVYQGSSYKISEILYESIYNSYKNSPKKYSYRGALPYNWEEEFYGMFLNEKKGDNSLYDLYRKIEEEGQRNNLDENEMAELFVAFVQSVTYDHEKAALVVSKTIKPELFLKYPYEVLYDQKGVCSDKSFLLYSILRKAGYGVALFLYDEEKHMSVGIRCPNDLSTYGSGYCYIETTTEGIKIGVIPSLDRKSNQALTAKEIGYYSASQYFFDEKRLGRVRIIEKTEGKVYDGILKTINNAKEIDEIRETIDNLFKEISLSVQRIKGYEDQITSLKAKVIKLKKEGNYDEYNLRVEDYNDLAETHKKEVDMYNDKVKRYNTEINRYSVISK